jgi:lambda family phage portal protein
VPYAYLSNDMLKANYSNSRLALLEFRRRIEAYQHAVMVWQLCRRVWARWMDTAVLAGALDLPDYEARRREHLACDWLPPKWDWVDPLKDARAEIEQIEAGLKSRTQALAERGYDAEQVDAEIAADRAREPRGDPRRSRARASPGRNRSRRRSRSAAADLDHHEGSPSSRSSARW